jgi:FHA domain
MSDPRFNSIHLGLSARREEYRQAREALLAARGLLTLAGEKACGLIEAVEDWPSLAPVQPDQLLPSARYLLVDRQAECLYPLKIGLNTIGRLPGNDVVLEEIWISRRHCVVLVHARGGCELHDTASRNGTFLNGHRLQAPARLASGDRIQVCQRLLLFAAEQDSQAGFDDDHPDTMAL